MKKITIEQALKYLDIICEEDEEYYSTENEEDRATMLDGAANGLHDFITQSKELLKKETPMKPYKDINIFSGDLENYCENCNKNISNYFNFCPHCGIKIDWSDEE